ncbi:MAG: small multi-drug export protein [Clostridia bacterium]|nr:small multi-drug export protein [Clostridia bacterium]
MAERLGEFLIELVGSPYIAVILVSMFPLIELKGAIPVGMTEAFGLSIIETALMAYIGSTVIAVLIFFLLKPIFKLLKKIKIFNLIIRKLEGLFIHTAEKIAAKTDGRDVEKEAKRIMMIALLIFVAVPFPVTGIWTGTAIAVFLSLRFREAILPLALGNLIAGSIITLLTFLFAAYVDIIIYVLFALALIMLAYTIYKIAKSTPTEE